MITFVEERSDYLYIKSLLDKMIVFDDHNKFDFPSFKEGYIKCVFSDFDLIKTAKFYDILFEQFPNSKFYFYVFSPDPDLYYYSNFNKYGILKFDNNTPSSLILKFLHESPKNSCADSIIDICDIVIVFAEEYNWAMCFDRDYEEGIFLSLNELEIETIKNLF